MNLFLQRLKGWYNACGYNCGAGKKGWYYDDDGGKKGGGNKGSDDDDDDDYYSDDDDDGRLMMRMMTIMVLDELPNQHFLQSIHIVVPLLFNQLFSNNFNTVMYVEMEMS